MPSIRGHKVSIERVPASVEEVQKVSEILLGSIDERVFNALVSAVRIVPDHFLSQLRNSAGKHVLMKISDRIRLNGCFHVYPEFDVDYKKKIMASRWTHSCIDVSNANQNDILSAVFMVTRDRAGENRLIRRLVPKKSRVRSRVIRSRVLKYRTFRYADLSLSKLPKINRSKRLPRFMIRVTGIPTLEMAFFIKTFYDGIDIDSLRRCKSINLQKDGHWTAWFRNFESFGNITYVQENYTWLTTMLFNKTVNPEWRYNVPELHILKILIKIKEMGTKSFRKESLKYFATARVKQNLQKRFTGGNSHDQVHATQR